MKQKPIQEMIALIVEDDRNLPIADFKKTAGGPKIGCQENDSFPDSLIGGWFYSLLMTKKNI